ncbi:adenylate kinase family protein [Candidatus Dependentiae bacterium]
MSAKSKIFVLLGAPGSGKGSLSGLLVEDFGWQQLSTGNLCRKHIEEQTEIGKQIDFVLKSGKLVDDSVIIEMVNQWLVDKIESGETVLLDGYPRNVVQAKALDDLLKEERFAGTDFKVIRFLVPDDVVSERLGSRRVCQNKDCQAVYSVAQGSSLRPKTDMICDKCSSPLEIRNDDKPDVIKKRLAGYHDYENDILNFYNQQGQEVVDIDAQMPLDDVFENFKKIAGVED